jgi:hypothetical protein
MKTYRILGILWLVSSCIAAVTVTRALVSPPPKTVQVMYYCIAASFLLLDLVGIVAGISLIRGAKWARWFLGLSAVWLLLGSVGEVVEFGAIPILTAAYGIFWLVSAVLFLMPRRYIAV